MEKKLVFGGIALEALYIVYLFVTTANFVMTAIMKEFLTHILIQVVVLVTVFVGAFAKNNGKKKK